MTPKTQCLPLVNSHRLWHHVQDLHEFKPNGVWHWDGRGGSRHGVPPLTKKLFVMFACWQRENQCSPVEYHWVYQQNSKKDPMPNNSWPTKRNERERQETEKRGTYNCIGREMGRNLGRPGWEGNDETNKIKRFWYYWALHLLFHLLIFLLTATPPAPVHCISCMNLNLGNLKTLPTSQSQLASKFELRFLSTIFQNTWVCTTSVLFQNKGKLIKWYLAISLRNI